MEKIKRNERIVAMVKMLSNAPNKSFTLNSFGDLFGTAKSTISEDIDIVREILNKYGLGTVETITGASGGVHYFPQPQKDDTNQMVERLCMMLRDPSRILPGGFLYTQDIFNDPVMMVRLGEIIASWYQDERPDFVLTVETKGIPVALMTARSLGIPMNVARRDHTSVEGSTVTINYMSGSARHMQTMSLPKRGVKEGQRALIVDDFMKAGGSMKGLCELMREFGVEIAGKAVVIETVQPKAKEVEDYRSVMVLSDVNEKKHIVDIQASRWIA